MQRFITRACGVVTLGLAALMAAVSANASYITTVLADNPTGYWRFDDQSGTTVANQIGGGVSGTYNGMYTLGATGALTASGDKDAAFSLNGAGNVSIPESAISDIHSGAFSMEVWFSTTSTARQDILNYKGGGVDFGLIYWGVTKDTTVGTLGIYSNASGRSSEASINTGTWYDIVITRNAASDLVTLYVNGQKVTSFADGTDIGAANHTLLVGSNHSATANDFQSAVNGSIDEFSIYKTELSSAQVLAHYNAATTPVPEPSTAILFGSGIVALLAYAWRKRR